MSNQFNMWFRWGRGWDSQMRDMTANDNMTPMMQMQSAREMERWAASRADNPSFAFACHAAARMAQQMREDARRR